MNFIKSTTILIRIFMKADIKKTVKWVQNRDQTNNAECIKYSSDNIQENLVFMFNIIV